MSSKDWGVESQEKYWFNTESGEVEKGMLSPAPKRLGPFATEAEAAAAMQTAKERAAKWQAEEEAEDNWGA